MNKKVHPQVTQIQAIFRSKNVTVEELIIMLEAFHPDTPVFVAINQERLKLYDPIVEVGTAEDEEGRFTACFINSEHMPIKATLN
jgi:hypothetical protein